MKTKNKLIITAMALVAIIAISLAVVGCEEEPEPQEHESTINAFDRDIIVKGDASITAGDFNNAKIKLQTAMTDIDDETPDGVQRDRFINMLDRPGFAIMITKGNDGPDASSDKKTMLIGVKYLIDNDAIPDIALGIFEKVGAKNAFAD